MALPLPPRDYPTKLLDARRFTLVRILTSLVNTMTATDCAHWATRKVCDLDTRCVRDAIC